MAEASTCLVDAGGEALSHRMARFSFVVSQSPFLVAVSDELKGGTKPIDEVLLFRAANAVGQR